MKIINYKSFIVISPLYGFGKTVEFKPTTLTVSVLDAACVSLRNIIQLNSLTADGFKNKIMKKYGDEYDIIQGKRINAFDLCHKKNGGKLKCIICMDIEHMEMCITFIGSEQTALDIPSRILLLSTENFIDGHDHVWDIPHNCEIVIM